MRWKRHQRHLRQKVYLVRNMSGSNSCYTYKKTIYDIGTEILYFQCFVTTDMFLFSKSIIPEDSKISRRDLEHVLWNLAILSDPGENLHAALDWEVTFLWCGAVPTKTPKRHNSKNTQKSKLSKVRIGVKLQKYNSSFAPASQQRIKRLNQSSKKKKYEI